MIVCGHKKPESSDREVDRMLDETRTYISDFAEGAQSLDGAEELDFTGPWEVFTASSALRDHADTVVLIAQNLAAVRCAKGMRVLPDHTLADHPPLDVLLVPGGQGTRREVANPEPVEGLKQRVMRRMELAAARALELHEEVAGLGWGLGCLIVR